MTPTRYAFIKANWHAEVVNQALAGFLQAVPVEAVDAFDVPGAFETLVLAKKLLRPGRISAGAAAASCWRGSCRVRSGGWACRASSGAGGRSRDVSCRRRVVGGRTSRSPPSRRERPPCSAAR